MKTSIENSPELPKRRPRSRCQFFLQSYTWKVAGREEPVLEVMPERPAGSSKKKAERNYKERFRVGQSVVSQSHLGEQPTALHGISLSLFSLKKVRYSAARWFQKGPNFLLSLEVRRGKIIYMLYLFKGPDSFHSEHLGALPEWY